MKSLLSKPAFVALSLLALTACNKKDDEAAETTKKPATAATTAEAAPTAAPTPAPTPSAPVAVVPETPAGFARAELDGKEPDAGWSGAALTTLKLTFTHPASWANKGGDFTVAAAADGSGGIAAGKYPDGAQPTGLRDAAAKALGLTECSWGSTDTIGLGKDKLPTQVADGTCKRDGKPAKAIFAATSGKDMNVLAVGGWDDGKDAKPVVNTFRSAKGVAGGTGDGSGVAACCAAIRQNMASAPIMYQGAYAAALGACNSAISNPQGKAALGAVRGMLGAVGVPAACK